MIFGGGSVGENRSYAWKVMNTTRQAGKSPFSKQPISFSEEDLNKVICHHEDPLVIEADISDECTICNILMDNGSAIDILYYNTS